LLTSARLAAVTRVGLCSSPSPSSDPTLRMLQAGRQDRRPLRWQPGQAAGTAGTAGLGCTRGQQGQRAQRAGHSAHSTQLAGTHLLRMAMRGALALKVPPREDPEGLRTPLSRDLRLQGGARGKGSRVGGRLPGLPACLPGPCLAGVFSES
jgi:hypothetical protein